MFSIDAVIRGNDTYASKIDIQEVSSSSLTVIIQSDDITLELIKYVQELRETRNHLDVYLLLSSGTFRGKGALKELKMDVHAKVVRCDSLVCDNLVFSLIMYEMNDHVEIIRWKDISFYSGKQIFDLKQKGKELLLRHKSLVFANRYNIINTTDGVPVIGLFDSQLIRNITASPCFLVEYSSFNVIDIILHFGENMIILDSETSSDVSCNVRPYLYVPNMNICVIINMINNHHLTQLLVSLCTQTINPKLIIFVQNEILQNQLWSKIPDECRKNDVAFQHIWNTNWNAYSYMSHYIPVPTDIDNTVIINDDVLLQPNALQIGVLAMRSENCIVSERGHIIGRNSTKPKLWDLIISGNISYFTYVDYSSTPLFIDSEWRKGIYKYKPYSNTYGDDMYACLSIYQRFNISSCVFPNFYKLFGGDSIERDVLFNRKYNSLDMNYTKAIHYWKNKGYVPLIERV